MSGTSSLNKLINPDLCPNIDEVLSVQVKVILFQVFSGVLMKSCNILKSEYISRFSSQT